MAGQSKVLGRSLGSPRWISELSKMADEVRDRTIIVKIKSQLHSWSDLEIQSIFSEFGMVEEVKLLPTGSRFHSQICYQTIYDSEWACYYYQDGWFVHEKCCEIQVYRADEIISWNDQRIDKITTANVDSDTPEVMSANGLLEVTVKHDELMNQGEDSSQVAKRIEQNSAKQLPDLAAHQVFEEMSKSILTPEMKFLDEIENTNDELVDGFSLETTPICSIERLGDVKVIEDGEQSMMNGVVNSVCFDPGGTDLFSLVIILPHVNLESEANEEMRNRIETLGNICALHETISWSSLASLKDPVTKAAEVFYKFPRGGDLLTYLYHELLVADQLMFYIGSFVVVLCWELVHHLHQVLHTKRFTFAPPKGSAAAESNPSEMLLASLEDSRPRCLLQYLAYLDLSMVCGSNIDTWRRAAFYEETGETYKRVVVVCLRPLDQSASCLGERLTGSADNAYKLSNQLCSPEDVQKGFEIVESFNDFQLYAWCAQAGAALTVHSHKEDDRFGVAQISGSHSSVLSTLLSSLLAVETFMGKKTNLQSPNHLLGPAGIKWATNSTSRREISLAVNKKRDSPLYSKAYALADILKTSIYCIVSEFHEEMIASAKSGVLDKNWVINTKPAYGSRDLLVQKLQFFLNFQAS